MKLVKWIVLCWALLLAVPCWAEFYRYVDAQGNFHFTDDLTQIPENQQKTLKPYGESAGGVKKNAGSAPVAATPPALPKSAGDRGQDTGRAEYDPREQGRQQALEKDYQTLLEEKASLEKEKERVSQKSRAKRNRSVKTLNKKIQSLNEKIDALKKRVEAGQGNDLLTNK